MSGAEEAFGLIDVLVNDAGIQSVLPIEDFPDEKWQAILNLNPSAAFDATKAAVPGMKACKRGRVINIVSAHGLVASPFKSAYVAAKHELIGFTKTIALETAEDGITVNAICPAYVLTPLVAARIPDTAKARGITEGAVMGKFVNHPRKSSALRPKRINLVLQDGGAHGAFTWGVLDYLLEDGRVEFAAISGTSAGAMNAVALADGYTKGGPEGAREKLHGFWQTISEASDGSPIKRAPIDVMIGYWSLDRSLGLSDDGRDKQDALTLSVEPDEHEPAERRAGILRGFRVRATLRQHPDLRFCHQCENRQGQGFRQPPADGGYDHGLGLPAQHFPVSDHRRRALLGRRLHRQPGAVSVPCQIRHRRYRRVQINPVERKGLPRTAQELQNHINEISFNSSLLKELRAIDFAARLIKESKLDEARYRL